MKQDPFRATTAQFVGAAVAVLLLVLAAFLVGRRVRSGHPVDGRSVPTAGALLGVGLALGWAFIVVVAVLNQRLPIGLIVGLMTATLIVGAMLLVRWSRAAGWTPANETAFAGGVVLTWVWYGFVQVPSVGAVSIWVDVLGNVVFSAGALLLLAKAWKARVKANVG